MRILCLVTGLAALSFFQVACDDDSPASNGEPTADGGDTGPDGGDLDLLVGTVVEAGAFKLAVSRSPWGMAFLDGDDDPVLVEHTDTGSGPTGTLAMHLGPPPAGNGSQSTLPEITLGEPATPPERDTGWAHATELIDSRMEGDTWVGTLATTDEARTLEVRAEAESDGVIALAVKPSTTDGVQALGVAFSADPLERFVGFGERNNAVDQSGQSVENYVAEGPYQDSEYAFITAVLPPWGVRQRPDTTYYPIPWLLSSRGYGVLIDNDELSYHRVGSETPDAWSMEVESTEVRFRVFAGPTPAEALERFSAAVGRQPSDYAPWFFGPWVQPDTHERIDELREADVPTSMSADFIHYLPDGQHEEREEQEREKTSAFHDKGTAVHTYFNPMIESVYQPRFDEAVSQGALVTDGDGETYIYQYYTSRSHDVAQFDFSSPAGIAAYKKITDQALANGYQGWMEDFGEYTPLDAISADGAIGTAFHNRYARDYHCGVLEATAGAGVPLARFARSGWTGSAACTPIVWGGDPTTTWGFDGLQSAVFEALSLGTSGVAIWGSDIGGFMFLLDYTPSDELLDRWIAFGALSVIMRNEKDGITIQENVSMPQVWEGDHLPIWRRYAKLHTRIYPYLQAAVESYLATGMPVMRHHLLTDPGDAEAIGRDDQYLFGPDLLVAPVYEEGASDRELYLPAGSWVEWWRSVNYVEDDGSFDLDAAEVRDGATTVTVAAPLDEIPLYVRAGAVIPMLAPDVFTLAEYGDDPSIVHLSDRDHLLHVLAFPRGERSGSFYDTGSYESVEGDGTWSLLLEGDRERTIILQASMNTLEKPIEPCSVTLDGTDIPATDWSYDAENGVLDVEYTTTEGVLVVSGC